MNKTINNFKRTWKMTLICNKKFSCHHFYDFFVITFWKWLYRQRIFFLLVLLFSLYFLYIILFITFKRFLWLASISIFVIVLIFICQYFYNFHKVSVDGYLFLSLLISCVLFLLVLSFPLTPLYYEGYGFLYIRFIHYSFSETKWVEFFSPFYTLLCIFPPTWKNDILEMLDLFTRSVTFPISYQGSLRSFPFTLD